MNKQIWIIVAAVAIGSAYKPLGTLQGVTPELLTDAGFWKAVGTDGLSSFAEAAKLGLGMVAGAFGIPILARGIEKVKGAGA